MDLNNTGNFTDLESLLDGASIKGSEIYNSKGLRIGKISELQSKLNHLFQTQVIGNADVMKSREAAFSLSSLLFQVEQLPQENSVINRVASRLFGHPFDRVKSACMAQMRQDPTLMQRVIDKYNTLATDWNAQIHYYHEDSTIGDSFALKQLRYLNDFLGLPWSRLQETGHESLPLHGELETFIAEEKSEIYKPSQCKTMKELCSLISRTASSPLVLEHSGHFTKEMVQEVEKRLAELYSKEIKRDSYSPTPSAMNTMMAIFELDFHRPKGIARAREVDKIWEESCVALKKDTPVLQRIHVEYNKGIEVVNHCLIDSGGELNTITSLDAYRNAFFGAILGLKIPRLTPSQKEMDSQEISTIFPASYLFMQQNDLIGIEQIFTFHSLLLNLQGELIKQRARLQLIEKQIHPDRLSNLLLADEKKKELQKERIKLEVALEGMPPSMPKDLFQSLWAEQLRRMEVLQIKPTDGQKRMSEALPLLGFDQPSPVKFVAEHLTVNMPAYIQFYNVRVNVTNTTRTRLELERKVKECRLKFKYATIAEMLDHPMMDHPLISEHDTARKQLEDWKAEVNGIHRGWNIPWTLNYRSMLIQIAEVFPFIKLNREIILGLEEWPRIDLSQIPRPEDAKLIPELQTLDPNKKQDYFNHWPEHWKQDLSESLKKNLGLTLF